MNRIHYCWVICATCLLTLVCTIGLTTSIFPTFLPYIIKVGGLTDTQGSSITTLRYTASFLSMLCFEKFYNRTNIRLGAVIILLDAAAAFALYSIAENYAGYCVAAIVAGIAHGLGGMTMVSILINRWFHSRVGTAIGICAAGSGLAATLLPPVFTAMIESISLQFAFLAKSVVTVAMATLVFLLIRNQPEDMGLTPYVSTSESEAKKRKCANAVSAPPSITLCMMAGAFLIGATAFGGMPYLGMLYTEAGFDSMSVSFALSIMGGAMTAGKFLYGYISDRLGTYRTGYIFFAAFVLGMSLCCFGNSLGNVMVMFTMICFGLGMSLSTVALSIFARDVSSAEDYPRNAKRFQMVYMSGALLFGSAAGVIADLTGSYIPAFMLLSVLVVLSMLLVQSSYIRLRKLRAAENM